MWGSGGFKAYNKTLLVSISVFNKNEKSKAVKLLFVFVVFCFRHDGQPGCVVKEILPKLTFYTCGIHCKGERKKNLRYRGSVDMWTKTLALWPVCFFKKKKKVFWA